MNRKDFLSAVVPLATVATAVAGTKKIKEEDSLKIPAYLKEGDIVGITCPSGYITREEIQPAISKLEEWGFKVSVGRTVDAKDFTFAGNDELRTEDLQQMLDDRDIDAILFARGGYGAVRIIDMIDFTTFKKRPKWLIGEKMQYTAVANEKNRSGTGEGILIGGNLSILQNLAGTKSDIHTAGKILFVEEVSEYLYSIDRMFRNLKRTGKLDKLKALVIGGFKNKPDDAGEEFGRTVYDIVTEVVKEFSYPVCFDFPVGHQKDNYALKCGVKHRLVVSADGVTLKEV